MNDSIIKIMVFYILHKEWRARICTNEPANWIWTLWLLSTLLGVFAVVALLNFMVTECLILVGGALVLSCVSVFFIPAAKRTHLTLKGLNHPVLFGDNHENV